MLLSKKAVVPSRREESNLQPTVYDTVALPLSHFGEIGFY